MYKKRYAYEFRQVSVLIRNDGNRMVEEESKITVFKVNVQCTIIKSYCRSVFVKRNWKLWIVFLLFFFHHPFFDFLSFLDRIRRVKRRKKNVLMNKSKSNSVSFTPPFSIHLFVLLTCTFNIACAFVLFSSSRIILLYKTVLYRG